MSAAKIDDATLPPPPVPPEADLRGLAWMRLDVSRLLDSDLFAVSNGAEFKAAVALWCKAWHQQPAGSLPDDPRVLAHLSGAGAAWGRVRRVALRGWSRASDGRLYHAVVSQQVLIAWEERQRYMARRESNGERLKQFRGKRKGEAGSDAPQSDAGNAPGNAGETPVKRVSSAFRNAHETPQTGQDETIRDNTAGLNINSVPAAPGAGAPSAAAALAAAQQQKPAAPHPYVQREIARRAFTDHALFGYGLQYLIQHGMGDKAARALLGQLRKICRDQDDMVFELVELCERSAVADPVPWLRRAAHARFPAMVDADEAAQRWASAEAFAFGEVSGEGMGEGGALLIEREDEPERAEAAAPASADVMDGEGDAAHGAAVGDAARADADAARAARPSPPTPLPQAGEGS
ncbi:MAG: DUF1376 domain-containing protein, partial [Solimonas sp.]